MALAPIISNEEHDALADNVKTFYVDRDGQKVLDVEVSKLPDIQKLQGALKKERDAAKKAQDALKQFTTQQQNEESDVADGLTRFKAETDVKNAKMTQQLDAANSRIKHLSIVERGTRAIASHKGIVAVLLPYLQQMADIDETGRPYIRGDDGKPVLRRNFSSLEDYMSLEEFIGNLKDDAVWSVAFESNGASGANTRPVKTVKKSSPGRLVKDAGGVQHWVEG